MGAYNNCCRNAKIPSYYKCLLARVSASCFRHSGTVRVFVHRDSGDHSRVYFSVHVYLDRYQACLIFLAISASPCTYCYTSSTFLERISALAPSVEAKLVKKCCMNVCIGLFFTLSGHHQDCLATPSFRLHRFMFWASYLFTQIYPKCCQSYAIGLYAHISQVLLLVKLAWAFWSAG